MKRIEMMFANLRAENKKALATFVTAGDPDLETTKKLVHAQIRAGASIIELGIPYSDPIAEGAVIQAANSRALKKGATISKVMNIVKELRSEGVDAPILYLLYFNVVLQYGIKEFLSDCVANGIDGLIIPDLPFEEQDELRPFCEEYDIDLITLVSPVSEERIEKIVKKATGFLYCVSSLGVTGVRSGFTTNFTQFFEQLNKYSALPKLIGFGISTPEQVKELAVYGDGVIVGSAIVAKIGNSQSPEEGVKEVESFVKLLKEPLLFNYNA